MPAGVSYLYKGTEEFNERAVRALETVSDVIVWGREKGLDDPKAQLNKVIEEVGEAAHEITRNHYDLDALEQPDELVDALGDILVTVIILADIFNLDPFTCLEEARDTILKRHGHTEDGTFIKDEENNGN